MAFCTHNSYRKFLSVACMVSCAHVHLLKSTFGKQWSNFLFWRQWCRYDLIFPTSNKTVVGSPPKRSLTRNSIAKMPQSLVFICCWTNCTENITLSKYNFINWCTKNWCCLFLYSWWYSAMIYTFYQTT